jgi:hypothetical protein
MTTLSLVLLFVVTSAASAVGGYCISKKLSDWLLLAFAIVSFASIAHFAFGFSHVRSVVFAGLALIVSGLVAVVSEEKHKVFAVPVYLVAAIAAFSDIGLIVVSLAKLG